MCIENLTAVVRASLCSVTRVNEANNLWRQRQITAPDSRDMNWLAQSHSVPLLQITNRRNEPVDG